MKDAYSFDVDDEASERSYQQMYEAYCRIFSRCGLSFKAVEADSGNIGGSLSQEFMVLAPSGEDEILSCTKCDYAANTEKAAAKLKPATSSAIRGKKEKKDTPGKKTVAEVAAFLDVSADRLIKTLLYKTESKYVAVLIPGDREINEAKLKAFLDSTHVSLASSADVRRLTGAPVGFSGPVELKLAPGGIESIVSDTLIQPGEKYVVGANSKDVHWVGVMAGEDFSLGSRVEVHRAREGDLCPRCGGNLKADRGIEVGHIFKLGTKYSEAMEAKFTDADSKRRPAVMGCYGIGIGRTAAAAIEQNHDEKGIIFPPPLAPFDVAVVPVEIGKEELRNEAERVYAELQKAGYDPLLDDREETAGKKFKDMDLLGIPVRITIGQKALSQSKLEVKSRREEKGEFIDPKALMDWVGSELTKQTRRTT